MKSISKQLTRNWPQAIAQVVLILTGILLAVAIDSLWSERQIRTAEISYLHSLRADLVSNNTELIGRIESGLKTVSNGQDILAATSNGLDPEELEEHIVKIGRFYFLSGYDGSMGTYDEMVSTGHVQYIQNQALRIKLATYSRLSEDIDTHISYQFSHYRMMHAPFLHDHLVISKLGWSGDYKPDLPFKEDMDALATRKFANLISDWIVTKYDLINYAYRPALVAGDELITVIDAELALKTDEQQHP